MEQGLRAGSGPDRGYRGREDAPLLSRNIPLRCRHTRRASLNLPQPQTTDHTCPTVAWGWGPPLCAGPLGYLWHRSRPYKTINVNISLLYSVRPIWGGRTLAGVDFRGLAPRGRTGPPLERTADRQRPVLGLNPVDDRHAASVRPCSAISARAPGEGTNPAAPSSGNTEFGVCPRCASLPPLGTLPSALPGSGTRGL